MQKAPWEPKANKEQTRESVVKYRLQPSLWDDNEKEIENLQKHAEIRLNTTEFRKTNAEIVLTMERFV